MHREAASEVAQIPQTRAIFDLWVVVALSIATYFLSAEFDFLERIVSFSRGHEAWEIDEFLSVSFVSSIALAIYSWRRSWESRRATDTLSRRNAELQQALAEIRQLRGILPICTHCKKIRDDEDRWHHLEAYIRDHSAADFSHGICPECLQARYGQLLRRRDEGTTPPR